MKIPFLDLAVKEALKVDKQFRVGAVIFKGKRVISRGRNFYQRGSKRLNPKFSPWPGSIHAEVDSILKARRDLKGCSIIVVRLGRNDQLRIAKPCKYCKMYLDHVGIKDIYYTINKYPYVEKL